MSLIRDIVYGVAVGDALGVPFEFLERDSFVCRGMDGFGTHHQPAGTWSDDTSLTLATVDSLAEYPEINTADMRKKFNSWYQQGAYTVAGLFDIGGTTARALIQGKGCSGERDNGNGSLMRILPLVATKASDERIAEVSAITHAHIISCEVCIQAVLAGRMLYQGASPQEVAQHFGINPLTARARIRSGGFVRDTFTAALWCLATTSSYKECVLQAVNLGSDTDTTAAVTGGFAGIVYGFQHIPSEWVNTLQGKALIDSILSTFEMKSRDR